MVRAPSNDDDFEVEAVIGRRRVEGNIEYLIRWKGYTKPTWNKLNDCGNCVDKIKEYARNMELKNTETSSSANFSEANGTSHVMNGHCNGVPSTSNGNNGTTDEHNGRKIWTFEVYEEWLRKKGYDSSLAHESQSVEMFLGRKVDKILEHYPYGERPYFVIQTDLNPTGITYIDKVIHCVDCVLVCKLFPKTFEEHSNFVAYAYMTDNLKQHLRTEKRGWSEESFEERL